MATGEQKRQQRTRQPGVPRRRPQSVVLNRGMTPAEIVNQLMLNFDPDDLVDVTTRLKQRLEPSPYGTLGQQTLEGHLEDAGGVRTGTAIVFPKDPGGGNSA